MPQVSGIRGDLPSLYGCSEHEITFVNVDAPRVSHLFPLSVAQQDKREEGAWERV
jgi:hypothetical protein